MNADLGDAVDVALGLVAEEHQRHVQRDPRARGAAPRRSPKASAARTARPRGTRRGRSSATNRRARGLLRRSAGLMRVPSFPSPARLAQQQPPQEVKRDGRGAVAHVGPRPREVDARARRAPPRRRAGRRRRSRPGRPASPRVPPSGPAMPVRPIADVGAEPLDRAVGHRLGDLLRDRAVALDQLRRHAEQLRSWPRSSRRRRRRRSSPTSRAGRSGAPPAARRARLPHRERRALQQARRPARRSSLPSVEKSESPWRSAMQVDQRAARPPRVGLGADHDLQLAAAQAGRDLEPVEVRAPPPRPAASRRSRTRGCRTGAASSGDSRSRRRAPSRNGSVSTACSQLSCSSRGGPGSTTTT